MTWKEDVLKVIRAKWSVGDRFSLIELYESMPFFESQHPENSVPEARVRRTLQELRDDRVLEFVDDRGSYRRIR